MASASLLSLSLCFLVLFHGCSAQIEQVPFGTHRQEQQQRFQSECRLDNLNVKEPYQRIESEAGVSEYWDQNDPQFQCAGVALVRHQIQRRGLLLPSFSNAPELIYVVQGRGLHGAVIPGCPETFQSDSSRQQTSRRGERPQPRSRDQHQKVRRIRQGDVIALPAGVAHWIYNDGDAQLVLVNFFDTSNPANQLDETARKFFLAGNPQQQGGSQRRGPSSPRGGSQQNSNNLFNGFDEEFLADSLNVDNDLARKLQCRDDQRGKIVRAKEDLQVLGPQWEEDERERERERESEKRSWEKKWGRGESLNGIEETFCTLRLKHNIGDPRRADVFNPHGGRISSLNSLNLPILRYLQLSAERGVLYREAMMTPHYNLNSHSVIYVIRGNARVQIVGDNGDNVFDGQLQQGQVLTVPQNFAIIKKAGREGFEWVSFKTNDNAKINPLAGRLSAIRAIPEDVLINAYRMEREEARRLKFNRRESTLLSSESLQRGRG